MRVAGVLMGSFVLTALLGIVRQSVIGSQFGLSAPLDAYLAGNRVSETLFNLISGGALGSAFIPVFARFLAADDMAGAWRLARAVMTWVSVIAGGLSILAAVFAVPIVQTLLIPGADASQQALTVDLLRIMLLTVMVFCVSGLCMAILNAHQHFFAASLAAAMYNIGLIVGALFFAPILGIYGLAWGAVLGAFLHLIVQVPTLRRIRFTYQPVIDPGTPGLREVLRLMLPRILGLAAFQLNFWVNTALTSNLRDPGALSALSLSFVLLFSVLGVIGQSVGTAVFPTLSALHSQGDTASFRRVLSTAMRGVLFMALPVTLGLIVLAEPFVALLFGRGKWTMENTVATAWALGLYAVGLAGFALQEILARAFYARRDTWTPVWIAVFGVILNVALSLTLIQVVRGSQPGQGAFGGLALANALTTLIESAILWGLMSRAVGGLHDRALLINSAKVAAAALIMGAAVAGLDRTLLHESALIIRLIVGGTVGVLIFEGVALALRLDEARTIPLALLRRVRR